MVDFKHILLFKSNWEIYSARSHGKSPPDRILGGWGSHFLLTPARHQTFVLLLCTFRGVAFPFFACALSLPFQRVQARVGRGDDSGNTLRRYESLTDFCRVGFGCIRLRWVCASFVGGVLACRFPPPPLDTYLLVSRLPRSINEGRSKFKRSTRD